jgi:hypothetical protein
MKTYHITYYLSRDVESDTGVLLSGISVEADNVLAAVMEYMHRMDEENLPVVEEIKYILEV